MSPTRLLCLTILAAGALLTPGATSSAQFGPLPNSSLCPRQPFESDNQWRERCDADEAVDADTRRRIGAQQEQEVARMRATLQKQAPLPPARNRLLGRWQGVSGAAGNDLLSQLAQGLGVQGCALMFGNGIVEFQPNSVAVIEGNTVMDVGATYREGQKGVVFVLLSEMFRLLTFEFESPDRVRMVGVPCTLVRVNAATGQSSRGAAAAAPVGGQTGRGTAAPPSARGQTGRASAAAAPAPAAAPGRLVLLKDQMAYQCADGKHRAIQSCFDDSTKADCLVIHMDEPPRNGFEVTSIDNRGSLIQRLAKCTARRVMLDKERKLIFAP